MQSAQLKTNGNWQTSLREAHAAPAWDVARTGDAAKTGPYELAVIVPTYNEAQNIVLLYELLEQALADVRWEMIVVDDDSPDGTADIVRALSSTYSNVRVLHRIGRRGLSTAVIEGMLATSAKYVSVIDADHQHDEKKLKVMLELLRKRDLDIVVGSRYAAGGGVGNWNSQRAKMSQLATRAAKLVIKSDLKDPMSGFFMMRRKAFEGLVHNLSGEGYKILLDLFASADRPLNFVEVPYDFKARKHGESKLDSLVMWEYLILIFDKLFGKYIPARLMLFALVGFSGLIIHLSVFATIFFGMKQTFVAAQLAATVVAMTTNYFLNNFLTYRDQRKKGAALFGGLLIFYAICSLGIIGNVGVAKFMFEGQFQWWLSSIAGVVIGTLWNYAVSSMLIWNKK
jgi:dolichol-phosphate mannosyltransferase